MTAGPHPRTGGRGGSPRGAGASSALVVGCGRVGSRVAVLLREADVELVLVDRDAARAARLAEVLGGAPHAAGDLDDVPPCDVVVLCVAAGDHVGLARWALTWDAAVVSTSDAGGDVAGLIDLDAEARERGVAVVAGAGFTPGLSCLLARHAANLLDDVDEVHVTKAGTGGPDCARQHHAALNGVAVDWREGGWVRRRGGSGRQLAYFPEPVGPRDCYRADVADAVLLQRAFPTCRRVTARVAATRRDRLTAGLPMLRRPHPEGGPGALRVEVWGRRGGQREVVVYGAVGPPGLVAGTVASMAAGLVARQQVPVGTSGLAEMADPLPWLAELDARGVRVASFEGVV
ncbi:MAG: hypothetical protein GEV08_08015 [Acidimicrobiia bacterium]|nr:hypothetical protein [Acidimicrobiia bacterium]